MDKFLLKGGSQNNEDYIIKNIFDKLNISSGTYFEIGVNNYTADRSIQCNSVQLVNKGWTGTLLDAKFKHPLVKNELVTVHNISRLVSNKIDFFSIDIDSYDWYIVKEILQKKLCDVTVFCVETNNFNGHCFLDRLLKLDAPAPNTQGYEKSDAFGATTFSFNILMEHFDYKLIATSDEGINAFFVKDEFSSLFSKAGDLKSLYKDSNNRVTDWNRRGPSHFMTTAQKEMLCLKQ